MLVMAVVVVIKVVMVIMVMVVMVMVVVVMVVMVSFNMTPGVKFFYIFFFLRKAADGLPLVCNIYIYI